MAFAIDGFSATFKATRGGIVDNLKAAAVYADATMETKTKGLEAAGVTIITQNMTQRDIGDIGVIIFTSLRRFERRGFFTQQWLDLRTTRHAVRFVRQSTVIRASPAHPTRSTRATGRPSPEASLEYSV